MTADVLSWNANWVQSNTGHTLTPDEARCIDTLAVIDTGIYNVHPLGGWERVEFRGTWVALHVHRGFSTYDSDHMTRLVIAACRYAVRVDLSAVLVCAEWDGDDVRYRFADDTPESETDQWDEAGEMVAAMRIQLNARNPHGTHLFERHPNLHNLARRVSEART
jgi:hypothetical protein